MANLNKPRYYVFLWLLCAHMLCIRTWEKFEAEYVNFEWRGWELWLTLFVNRCIIAGNPWSICDIDDIINVSPIYKIFFLCKWSWFDILNELRGRNQNAEIKKLSFVYLWSRLFWYVMFLVLIFFFLFDLQVKGGDGLRRWCNGGSEMRLREVDGGAI